MGLNANSQQIVRLHNSVVAQGRRWFPSCTEGGECRADFLANVNRARPEQIRVGEAQHTEALTYKSAVTFAVTLKRTWVIVVLAPIRLNNYFPFHHEVHAPDPVNEPLRMHSQPCFSQAHARQSLNRRLGTGIGVSDEPLSARSCQTRGCHGTSAVCRRWSDLIWPKQPQV